MMKCIINIALCLFGMVWNFISGMYNGWGVGNQVLYQQYGGDAYTGIQNAAAKTGNNVYIVTRYLEGWSRWLAIISTIVFLMLLLKNIEKLIIIVKGLRNSYTQKECENMKSPKQDGVLSDQ